MSRRRVLYVVETQTGVRVDRWEPCLHVCLSRRAALQELREWRSRNPGDKFRIRRYVPEVEA